MSAIFMQVEPRSTNSFVRLTERSNWIGPASGLICSVLISLIGRAARFEYRSEASIAAFFIVSILVSAYYNRRLKTHPVRVLALAIVGAFAGVAIARL